MTASIAATRPMQLTFDAMVIGRYFNASGVPAVDRSVGASPDFSISIISWMIEQDRLFLLAQLDREVLPPALLDVESPNVAGSARRLIPTPTVRFDELAQAGDG